MFSAKTMPSTTQVLSTYTTFAASAMLVRSVVSEVQNMTTQLVPEGIRVKIMSKLGGLFGGGVSNQMTLIFDENIGPFVTNEVFEAAELFLRTRITPSIERLKVTKSPGDKNFSVTISKGEKVLDTFEGMQFVWEMICTESDKSTTDYEGSFTCEKVERKSIELSFNKKYKEKVLKSYLPYVIERSKIVKEENNSLKLYSGSGYNEVKFDHPSTFDTLAMDPSLKQELKEDLDRFVKRRDYYRGIGKAWKRGYLLYGPPGTGKSSLIAAMANYLRFNIYDLELTSLRGNDQLRQLLVSTGNRSILVIEDIDCSVDFGNRQDGEYNNQSDSQLTLSGLLNFIDGLWSSCVDERIIVFTTNHKERLDPALLRPGRMDKHIHMSYCTPCGFKILASNYLNVKNHNLFTEIEKLVTEVDVTPAEVAEELMGSEEADVAFGGLIKFLQDKKAECARVKLVESENSEANGDGKGSEIISTDGGSENTKGNKRKSGKGKNIGPKKRKTRSSRK